MGQVFVPAIKDIILTDVDRLVARNADGGLSPASEHVILLGEDAGQNLSVSNVIALGAFSLDNGLADPILSGTIAIGVNAGSALTTSSAGATLPNVIIGENAALLTEFAASMVVIGADALSTYVGDAASAGRCVIIGSDAARRIRTSNTLRNSVVIGHSAAVGAFASSAALQDSVILGYEACTQFNTTITQCVVIGSGAAQGLASGGAGGGQNVVIGYLAGEGLLAGIDNVCIGRQADINNAASQTNNVAIGATSTAGGVSNVVLGFGARAHPAGTAVTGVVALGSGAGALGTGADHRLYIENNVGGTERGLIYGHFDTGSLLVGDSSTAGGNRDLPGTNILKIINGTVTGVAPVGGGFFYSVGGELHWVSSGNVDSPLTPSGIGLGIFTVATLPVAAAGSRAFVTDALAPAFGAAVAGGGAVFIPVFRDNAATWIVG